MERFFTKVNGSITTSPPKEGRGNHKTARAAKNLKKPDLPKVLGVGF